MGHSRIKLLQFTNTTVRAGVEEHLLRLLQGLDRDLFEGYLVCPDVLTEQFGSDIPADVSVARLTLESPFDVQGVLRLARLIRRWRPHVVHSHMFRSSLVASPIAFFCGVPVIVETPHVREGWRRGRLKGSFAVDRLVSRVVSRYIAVSEANARYLVDEKGIPAQRVRVIRNGIDLARFDRANLSPREIRRAKGFGESDPLVVVVARLEPQKGHRVLLEALSRVIREFPALRVALVGDGALREELEQLARSLGLERVIHFAGRQPDPENWLSMADITVLPSFYEGLPIAAIESLAVGTPVVATAVDGTPEVVVNGKTGLTVPPGDPGALAASICRMVASRELRCEFGRAGRHWVMSHFGREQQVAKTQELYLGALSDAGIHPASAGPTHEPSAPAPIAGSAQARAEGCSAGRIVVR